MNKVYVFLADGFEEIEGLTVVDILRRGKVDVQTVSIGEKRVCGSHGIVTEADLTFDEMPDDGEYFVLPGGMPGTLHLKEHAALTALLKAKKDEGKHLAAICAAPSVLGEHGLLEGCTATCYPGFEDRLKGAVTTQNTVEVCGNITTSRGMGTAIPFALCLLEQIMGKEAAETCGRSILYL